MKILSKAYWTLVCIWFVFGIALNIGTVMYVIRTGEAAVLLLAAVWWAITLIAGKIHHRIEQHQLEKARRQISEYRDKYITDMPVEDELFGRVVFEYDSNLNTLGTDDFTLEKPFDRHTLTLYSEFLGRSTDIASGALRFIYSHSEEILQKMYDYTLESCRDVYDECDSSGRPYDMSYISRNMNVYSLRMFDGGTENEVCITLCGDICGDDGSDLLGCHAVTAYFTLDTSASIYSLPEIQCGLEG